MTAPDDLLGPAFTLAFHAHAGQVDKSGEAYIAHVVRVAALCDTEDERTVALLHDTVEDTAITEADIRDRFPARIADAVMALTHPKHEPLEDYMTRVNANALARRVKLADLSDNSAPARLERLPGETQARLKKKYRRSLELLHEGRE